MNLKHICTLLLCLLSCLAAWTQSEMNLEWSKFNSLQNGNSEGWGVSTDSEGNIFWPYSNDSLNQGLDVYCEKFNPSGVALWDQPFHFGGSGAQQAYVCNSDDSTFYIGGRICSGLVNTCDMMLLKVDPTSGNLIWDRSLNFEANGYDELDGLEIKEDGIYCGGWAQSLESEPFFSELGFWKVDFNGNTIWQNSYGIEGSAEHQDGHFVVDDEGIFAAGLWQGTGLFNLYNGSSFLGEFSKTDGSLIQETTFGTQSNDFLDIENALGMTSDGTYLYITGYSTPNGANDWQISTSKFDKDMNNIWTVYFGEDGTETARGIGFRDGKVFVAGLTESENLSNGGADALMLVYDTDGNLIEYQTWGTEIDEALRDIAFGDDAIYLSGTQTADDLQENAFLLKLGYDLSTGINQASQSNIAKVYPNPSNGKFTVSIHDADLNQKAILFDLQGRAVLEIHLNASNTEFYVQNAGIYLLVLENGYREKVVVR